MLPEVPSISGSKLSFAHDRNRMRCEWARPTDLKARCARAIGLNDPDTCTVTNIILSGVHPVPVAAAFGIRKHCSRTRAHLRFRGQKAAVYDLAWSAL